MNFDTFAPFVQGIPTGAVKITLTDDGHDPSILDQDPEKPVEYLKAMPLCSKSVYGKKKNKENKKEPRRKKIFWNTVKQANTADDSLWSIPQDSVPFDWHNVNQDEFQSVFTETSQPAGKKLSVAPKKKKKKRSVQVIDPQRGMNGGIILARVRTKISVLAEMVEKM